MSILFADDFMGYGMDSSLLLNGLWGSVVNAPIVADPDPNAPAGSLALRFSSFGNSARHVFLVGAVDTAGVAMRLWMPGLPIFTANCIRMLDGSNACQCCMTITPTGGIQIRKGGMPGATLLAETAVPVLTANAFHHIEFRVDCDVAVGAAEVRVDGISVLIVTGVNTGTALQVGFGTTQDNGDGTSSRTDYIKDLVVWDGDGTHNNDFLGTVSVVGLTTNSDVSLNWTPSTGATGWPLLDNSPPLDGSEYITAPFPAPAAAVFGLTNLPINVTSVRALISQVRARKVDGGDGNLQNSLVSSGDTVNGSDRPITTAFTYYEDVFETDPHTAASWLPAAVDAVNLKINRTV